MAYTWEELVEECKNHYIKEWELMTYFNKISDYIGYDKTKLASSVKNIGGLVNDVIYSQGKESIEIKNQSHTFSQRQGESVAPSLEEQKAGGNSWSEGPSGLEKREALEPAYQHLVAKMELWGGTRQQLEAHIINKELNQQDVLEKTQTESGLLELIQEILEPHKVKSNRTSDGAQPSLLSSFTEKIREAKLLFLRLLEPIAGLSPSPSNNTNERAERNDAEPANRPFIEHIRDVSYDMLQNASRLIRRNRDPRVRNRIQ